MYQISQMLRDQKSLIQNILDTSIIAKRPTPQVPITPTEPEAKAKSTADDNRKKLLTLLEKVEGATVRPKQSYNTSADTTSLLFQSKTENQHRYILILINSEMWIYLQEVIEHEHRVLIHEGDLLEIDPDSYSAVQRKRGYLFNDGIMLAQWVPNR